MLISRTAVSLASFLCVATLLNVPAIADASACDARKVASLSREGHTIAAISRECKMDKDDVQTILDDDDTAPPPPKKRGLPSGEPLGQCGCWGPINPNYFEAQPACSSGYSRPQICNVACYGGGYAWVAVCK